MGAGDRYSCLSGSIGQQSAVRLLVESALAKIASDHVFIDPSESNVWMPTLLKSLVDKDEGLHKKLLVDLTDAGLTSRELLQQVVPDAARRLGEMWLSDEASFVDVTVGAARLQALFDMQSDVFFLIENIALTCAVHLSAPLS